ncbi:DUF3055 domain-containing protein [Mechercharimyces sp. CAU 1602]|uniref:DUF3055 domain-containing protein n=1 Tax=Mechercharimyces sp. CAU 1602 TaxID=2973933 RepID=UPI002163985B|nr:DUF3055 domain-containing protein [Mechercharimyces sp. CAU 1602]MCS1351787.1 DUF3055 domain-containing protein [Mechercharimyces sp. CAU 1602]
MNDGLFFLYDEQEDTSTRFLSFVGKSNRFDLALVQTSRFYGKMMVLDLQSNRFALIGSDDLEEEGNLEYAFQINHEEADELRSFLNTLL